MHIRKCNENSRKEKRRGKEPEGWGGGHSFISVRCQQNQRQAKLPRSSEKGASIAAEIKQFGFCFTICFIMEAPLCIFMYQLQTMRLLHETRCTQEREEAQSSFYQDFRSHLGRCTSIVFVIAVIIIISIRFSFLEEFSTTNGSSEFYKNKIICKGILRE